MGRDALYVAVAGNQAIVQLLFCHFPTVAALDQPHWCIYSVSCSVQELVIFLALHAILSLVVEGDSFLLPSND